MQSLAKRSYSLELMDSGGFKYEELKQTLEQLRLINVLTDGYRPTFHAIESLLPKSRPVRILDLGFGYGDMLRKIYVWAKSHGIAVELTGVDINPWAVDIAQRATPPDMPIQFQARNIFDFRSDEKFDIIINSLFMHHLKDAEILKVIEWMQEHSEQGWFINDLHRHPVAYYFIKVFTRAFGFNRLIQNDAPLSVARSFSRVEWENYLLQAKIPLKQARIHWHWTFRYGVLFQK